MAIYDYHNDPEILARAEAYDNAHPRLYDQFINSADPELILFYDENVLRNVIELPPFDENTDTVRSFLCYRRFLFYLFKFSRSAVGGLEEVCGELIRAIQVRLFDSYISKLVEQHRQDYQAIDDWCRKWVDVTMEIIVESFELMPFPKEGSGIYDNLDLCKQALGMSLYQYEESLAKMNNDIPLKVSNVILYNFWGNDYGFHIENIDKYSAPSTEDNQKTDRLLNCLLFEETIREYVKKAVALTNQTDPIVSYLDEPKKLIGDLFSAYTKLLRIRKIKDVKSLAFAIRHWRYMTEKIIYQVTEIERQRFRMSEYPPGSVLHSQIFVLSLTNRKRYDAILEFRKKISTWVQFVCDSYENRLHAGDLRYPWAEGLDNVRIDYSGLYKLFITEGPYHYLCGISEADFRDAIESAQINVLMDHLAIPDKDVSRGKDAKEPTRDTSKAAIRFLVQQIGRQVRDWYDVAAASMLDSNGKPYTVAALQSLHPTEETARMSELLAKYMTIQPVRQYHRRN